MRMFWIAVDGGQLAVETGAVGVEGSVLCLPLWEAGLP